MFDEDYRCEKCDMAVGRTLCDNCGVEIPDTYPTWSIEEYGGNIEHTSMEFCSPKCLRGYLDKSRLQEE